MRYGSIASLVALAGRGMTLAVAVLAVSAVPVAATVLKPDPVDRASDRPVPAAPKAAAEAGPAATATVPQQAPTPPSAPSAGPHVRAGKAAVDPNQPDPPSARAAAAAERAKRALEDEGEDDVADAEPTSLGQPVSPTTGRKTAATGSSVPKCLAGC